MTSICNYSHPELQITDGLVRHRTGTLFPYNPEFYDLTSGLYGPGSIYCWQLLLASVILNWIYWPLDDDGERRRGISNDLLGVVAYPTFAATDALIHAMKMLGMKYRALSIFCLRYPGTHLEGMGYTFNQTQLDLHSIPPDVLNLGQHVIDITGPVTVCYMFTTVTLLLTPAGLYMQWLPTPWATRLIYGTYAYVMLILTIYNLSLGDLVLSFLLNLYEAIMPPIYVMLWVIAVAFSASCLIALVIGIGFLLGKVDKAEVKQVLPAVPGFVLLGGPPIFMIATTGNDVKLIPDQAISVRERDQLAALIVGIVTLCFTSFNILRRLQVKEETAGEVAQAELQTLNASNDA